MKKSWSFSNQSKNTGQKNQDNESDLYVPETIAGPNLF